MEAGKEGARKALGKYLGVLADDFNPAIGKRGLEERLQGALAIQFSKAQCGRVRLCFYVRKRVSSRHGFAGDRQVGQVGQVGRVGRVGRVGQVGQVGRVGQVGLRGSG